ncbi:twitching motility protein PilT [candidate division KSB1 bacterium RBG_16_48_16]|nr:MAG: twitching motility protein PilT [candidate division KSB1 bacterium RBG_16_48_16]
MKPTLVDTDILSMYFRGNHTVIANFDNYNREYGKANLSIITYYEIISGLKHRDAKKQLESFLSFSSQNTILLLTEESASVSAEIYANLRKKGQPIDDIDLLIAGIAVSNNMVLTTNNEDDFKRIQNLEIVNWSKKEY